MLFVKNTLVENIKERAATYIREYLIDKQILPL